MKVSKVSVPPQVLSPVTGDFSLASRKSYLHQGFQP
jgi:hypothetical protein